MVEKLVQLITIEDLTENNRYIADLIGIDIYREIVKKFHGEKLYIQDPRSNKKLIKEYVKQEMSKNKPIQKIAKELGKNRECIRNLIKEID
jgi:predicted transcriptional regulator